MIKIIAEVENEKVSFLTDEEASVRDVMLVIAAMLLKFGIFIDEDDFDTFLKYIKEEVAYEREQMCEPDRRS